MHNQIDGLTALGQELDSQLGPVARAAAKPRQGQHDTVLGIRDHRSVGAGMIVLTTGFMPLRTRRERASNLRMRWSNSAICIDCSAVCARKRASFASLMPMLSVVDGGIGMSQTCCARALFSRLS